MHYPGTLPKVIAMHVSMGNLGPKTTLLTDWNKSVASLRLITLVNGFVVVAINLGHWVTWKLMGLSSMSRLDALLIPLDFKFSNFMKCILQEWEILFLNAVQYAICYYI